MKPIGPYVAARELPGRDVAGGMAAPATVRTLRATDRLTGMPVLVHVLPTALSAPQLPPHPALLPYSDEGTDGDDAYLVTELPLHAVLAADPLLAARGALAGLAALHSAGLVHGGVSASQLWSVDGHVALAGAGLPWSEELGSPDDDLRALAEALVALGGLPEPLRPLRDSPATLTAQTALARLQAGATSESSASSGRSDAGTVQTLPAEAVQVELALADAASPPPPALHDGTPITLREPIILREPAALGETAPDPAAPNGSESGTLDSATPDLATLGGRVALAVVDVAFTDLPDVPARSASPTAAEPTGADAARATPAAGHAAESAVQPTRQQGSDQAEANPVQPRSAEASSADHDGPAIIQLDLTEAPLAQTASVQASPDALDAGVTLTAVRPPVQSEPPRLPAVSPVSVFSTAPPGVAETPQERRKRQNDERRAQAMQDSRAAAERKAAARREREAAQPALVQIEFDDLPDLPDADSESPQTGVVGMRFPESVNVERVPASMRRPPLPAEPAEGATTQEVGRLPARRTQGEPIRIGWAEDNSWRVVRAPGKSAPARPSAPRWLLPLLAALLLVGGAVWAYFGLSASRTPAAAAEGGPCCTVRFTVQGAAGVTARLSVLDAPAAANLTPGQDVGVAPGPVKLPVRGTYRLRVAADGYAPGTLSVTTPTTQPVRIDLGP
ncbi:hypothetical protein ACFFLM_18870 [Deinococcus oregonensis]|uniref:PEGA domain-containing protein n=1 Tax=Deinococcus oregonensis TaxID=1805970 RepID=A0ABV6B2N9_9DEIO